MVSNTTHLKGRKVIDDETILLIKKFLHGNDYPTLSSVRRNLFGIPKKVASPNKEELDEQLNDMAKKSSEEWNFDFLNELPLTGRYVWQRVHSCDVPVWFTAVSKPPVKLICAPKPVKSSRTVDSVSLKDIGIQNEIEIESSENPTINRSSKKPRLLQTSMKGMCYLEMLRIY